MSIFLDTSFIVAFSNESDVNHKDAIQISELIKTGNFGNAFISTYIFDEAVTLVLVRQNHAKAVSLGNSILNSEISVLDVSHTAFEDSWKLFNQRKNLSFTDCTSIKIMLENGIRNIATFDRGFKQFKEINVLM